MNHYTAYPHFGHERIIEFCGRPFRNVAEMDAMILANYQSAVSPDDDLWIVGDLAVCRGQDAPRLESMLASIQCRKHLIVGNHDKAWIRRLSAWDSVHDFLEIRDEGRRVVLCHYPLITFPGARHGAINLFGHVHQNWQGSRNSVNVGVDCWNFGPVTMPDIAERAAKLPVNPIWPLVEPRSDL